MKQISPLVLASGSPRRAQILTQMGVQYSILVSDIDESRLDREAPADHVERLAREKALAGLAMGGSESATLGADTIVVLDGEILGKPKDRSQAIAMLGSLAGRTHQVYSALAIAMPDRSVVQDLSITGVTFAAFPPGFVESYCATSDPMDKAGAYAIQGDTGQFISRIEGSYSGVMGLPVFETARLLSTCGVIDPAAIRSGE